MKGRLQGAKREEIKQRAIDALRSAAAIVDQKAPNDAAAYKSWLLQIANNVAEASKEGGFLGCSVPAHPNERLVPPRAEVIAANDFARANQSRATLKLLHGEQSQRVPHNDANARSPVHSVAIATQTTKSECESRETQVSLAHCRSWSASDD